MKNSKKVEYEAGELGELSPESLYAWDDLSPYGYHEQDAAKKTIITWDALELVKRLKSSTRQSAHEFAEFQLVERAVEYLNTKLSRTFLKATDPHTDLMPVLKLVQRLGEVGYDIIEISKSPAYNDVPKVAIYSARCDEANGSGADLYERGAMMTAVSEAVERRLFQLPKTTWIRDRQHDRMRGLFFPPDMYKYYLLRQKSGRQTPEANLVERLIHFWVEGLDWNAQQRCWLPAQLVFYGPSLAADQVRIAPRTSNGCAVGSSFEDAAEKAIIELIERDAFMLSWIRKIPPRSIINSDLLKNVQIGADTKGLIAATQRYRLELNLLYLETDFPVHAVCCVIRDLSGVGPAVVVGGAASLSLDSAVRRSLLEALLGHAFVRTGWRLGKLPKWNDKNLPLHDPKLDRQGRLSLWGHTSMLEKICWFLAGKRTRVSSLPRYPETFSRLEQLVEDIRMKGYHLYFFTIPDKQLQQLGYWAVRAIIPELVPLYLTEGDATLHHPRLLNPPGAFSSLPSPDSFDPLPHPFP